MPNWIIHIAIADIFPKKQVKTGFRYLLLGTVLPDISRIGAILIGSFKFEKILPFSFLEAFHTPFMMVLLALAIGILTERPGRVFFMIFLGSTLHFICDMAQPSIGGGTLIFYPLYYHGFRAPILIKPNGWIHHIFNFLSLCALFHIYIYLKDKKTILLNKKRIYISIILLFISVGIAYTTIPLFLKNNTHFSRFIKNPDEFEGKEVLIHVDRIVSENPLEVFVKHAGVFKLITNESVKIGDWVSARGIYRKGSIKVSEMYVDITPFEKSVTSLVGLLFLIMIFDLKSLLSS